MTRWEHIWAIDVLAAFAPASSETRSSISATPSADSRLTPHEGEVDYFRVYRRLIAGSTPLAALGLRFALLMVVLAPVWLLGRFITFSALARAERTELLSRLLRHTSLVVRELSLLLKFAAAVALLGTPSVRERSGYDTPQATANVALARESTRRALPVFAQLPTSAAIAHVTPSVALAPHEAFAITPAHEVASTRPSDQVAS
jgi:hypothetical protein